MATWAKCSELFLYTKGNDVYLWRCNKTTWMPMITANFEDLGKVTDYLDLIGGKDSILDWDKSSYNDLVAYISPRRLLVNSRGLVIAELGKYDEVSNKMEENELPFYIRLLDVLSLKPFGLRDRTIPSRTVRYLETEGRAAPVEGSTTTTTTELDDEKRAAGLVKQVAELIAANKTLKSDKEVADKQVTELKETNKILKSEKEVGEKQETELEDRKKALVADVAAQKTVATNAQQERDGAKRDKEATEKQVAKLKERNKKLKRDKEAEEKKAVDLQTQIDAALPTNEKKEVWMSNITDQVGTWNVAECLRHFMTSLTGGNAIMSEANIHVVVVHGRGSFYTMDLTTNVQASYMYHVYIRDIHNNVIPGTFNGGYKAVRLNDLNPYKEKAKFCTGYWFRCKYNGDLYVIKVTY